MTGLIVYLATALSIAAVMVGMPATLLCSLTEED